VTWQFWIALASLIIASALGVRREIINRRFVREYLASLWIREQNAIEAERKCLCDRDAHGHQRHLFGIAQGYRGARHEAERFLRRDW
jgi:hypothetical protein